MFYHFSKESKDYLMVQRLKWPFIQNISCKKKLNQNALFTKELRRSDFLITIEEYVEAKGNALVDHKKDKNIKRHKKDIRM